MLFGLLDRRPLLDEAYAGWMFDVYAWALRNFDPVMFRDETFLVTPSNQHFPGRANSPEEMANLIFKRVIGTLDWPFGSAISVMLLSLLFVIVWTYNRYLGINQIFKSFQGD